MKKILTALMLATMMLSVGCGNNTIDGAKKDAQEAAQQIEQKADEIKDAAAKVDELKQDAESKIDEISEGAEAMRESMGEISFNGIVPGFSIDEVKETYGEPVEVVGEVLTFVNGAIVNVDTQNIVKSIRLTTSEISTPKGVSVGMSEYALNDTYGTADAVHKLADGAEYEYHIGKDKISKLIFTTRNGIISEIRNEFNK